MCQAAQGAGTKEMLATELAKLDREHPSNYSREKLLDVCGVVQEAT